MQNIFLIIPILILLSFPPHLRCEEYLWVVHPQDTGAVLINPQMGWVFHYYDNRIENYGSRLEPSDTVDDFPGISVIYLRLPWSYIEPEAGKFNWSIVDTPAQRWIDKGKQIAFRFSCCESFMRYATPKWVETAGAKGNNFSPGKIQADGPYWEPDYGDPIFLKKLEHFLAAAAARYDGNPNVAFIDIGSIGVWGEGHTSYSTKIKVPPDIVKKHIDLHLKYFPHTLLAANDDLSWMEEKGKQDSPSSDIIRYACEQGLTLRDDSILVEKPPHAYYNAEKAQLFWRKLPVVLECEHYGKSRDRGIWGDGSMYLQAVEEYHGAYASIHWWPREFMQEQADLIQKINQRLGYRLQLREFSCPKTAALEHTFTLSMKWANVGVAPCYPGGCAAITLKDAKGGITAVWVDEMFSMQSLPTDSPGKAPVQNREMTVSFPPNMKAGLFEVFISIGKKDGTPIIALPLPNEDGHRRYKLGSLEVITAK